MPHRTPLPAPNIALAVVAMWFACMNDVLAKIIAQHELMTVELLFWRFTIGLLAIVCAMLFNYFLLTFHFSVFKSDKKALSNTSKQSLFRYCGTQLSTQCLLLHAMRGVLFAVGLFFWNIGLSVTDITSAITIGFSQPIITMVLAAFMLHEKVSRQTYLFALIGFLGVLVVFNPLQQSFVPQSLALLIATFLWSFGEILNKKVIDRGENIYAIFLYSTLTAFICSIPFYAIFAPKIESLQYSALILLIAYGVSGQLMILCHLLAMRGVKASILMPLRYSELVFAVICGYFIFDQLPTASCYFGASLIIVSTIGTIQHNARRIKCINSIEGQQL